MTRRYDGWRWGRTLPTGVSCPHLTPEDGRTICDDAPVDLDLAATARRRGAHERVWRCRRCRSLLLVTAADIDSALYGVPDERAAGAVAAVLHGDDEFAAAHRYGVPDGPDGWRVALAGATPQQRLAVARRLHDPAPTPQQEVAELEALLGLARHSLQDRGDGVYETELAGADGDACTVGTAP